MDPKLAAATKPRSLFLSPWAVRAAAQMAATLVLSSVAAYLFLRYHTVFSTLGPWNYLSVFFAELAASATIIVPAPGQVYVFAVAPTLNPGLVALIGGFAAALGELSGYLIGVSGHRILQGGRTFERFRALFARWGGSILFGFAVLPVPFDVAGVWAGSIRYPVWRFLLYVIPGKVIKVGGIALAGYYSAPWLLRVLF